MTEENNPHGEDGVKEKVNNETTSSEPKVEGVRFQSTFRRSNTPNNLDEIGMIAINNIVKGIGNFINYVNEVADRIEEQARLAKERADERQAEMREEGEIETPGGRKANFGFSFRTGILGNPPARTRPTPRPPSPYQSNRPAVTNPGDIPTREPMMDVFDETDSVLVVAELPGVAEKDIIIEIHEDILILRATGKTYHYEKECLLPATVDPQSLNKHYKNGMLELRLKRVQPPVATESDE